MVGAGFAVDLLLQTGEGAEGLDTAVDEIELAFRDVACVVRNRMRHVVAGHGGDGENRDGSGGFEIDGLFITGGELAVEVAWVAAVGRNLFHRDGDFLQCVAEVRHVRQQDEHAFVFLRREIFGGGEGHVRHEEAFDDRVGGGVDEHDGAGEGALLVQSLFKIEIVVVFESHAAEDDDVDFGLHGDTGEQFVVGFAGDGEDRQLLAFDERVENVDHGQTRADHVLRNDAVRGVDGGAADVDHVVRKGGAFVTRRAVAGEDSSEQGVRRGDAHGLAEEADFGIRRDASRACEDLQIDSCLVKTDDLRKGCAARRFDFRQFAVGDIVGLDGDDVAADLDDAMVDFLHYSIRC